MKSHLINFDRYFFNGKLLLLYNRVREFLIETTLSKNDSYKISFFYSKNNPTSLNVLSEKYGSDKGSTKIRSEIVNWRHHNYADLYQLLFTLGSGTVECVVECGIGTSDPELISSMGHNGKPGASLRMWQEFFPSARVIGLDIDEQIMFQEDRIETYNVDQTNPTSIAAFVAEAQLGEMSVDILIDDGLHEFLAGKTLYENTIGLVKAGGFYIIEDVLPVDLTKYQQFFKTANDVSVTIITLRRPGVGNSDNNLIIAQKL